MNMNGPKLWSYIRHYRFNSILLRNFILIMTLIIVPLVGISAFVYAHNDANMRAEIQRSTTGELTRIRDSVDMVLSDAERLSIRVKSDPDVGVFLTQRLSSPLNFSDAQRILRIQQVLQTVMLTSSYIDSIFIYSHLNDFLLTSGVSQSEEYYARWPEIAAQKQAKTHEWLAAADHNGNPLLSFVNRMNVGSFTAGQDSTGTVSINMNVASLNELLTSTAQQSLFLLNGRGEVVYSQNSGLLNRNLEEADPELAGLVNEGPDSQITKLHGRNLVVSRLSSQSVRDWSYVSMVSLELYQPERARILELMVVLLTVSAFTSIILAFIIAIRSYRPIRQILSLIESKENPFYMPGRTSRETWNETGYILTNLSASFHQSHNIENQLQEKYELLRKAQAIALQAQINPHFLYNTLESINWKVMRLTNGKNEASQMILSLSTLLRLTLETKEDLIPLRRELEHVTLYAEMQKLRYKDRFHLECHVEEKLMDCKIVKLVLQPLVENAIYYGIKQSPHKGTITIRAFARREIMVIRVRDNGVGIPPLTLQYLNESLRGNILQENEHIGLRNVNQRIRLAFGEQYGLSVRSRTGAGTIVEITLPMLAEERGDQA
ncbi:MAG: hypothetical protein K0Q90_400 [Paenibacillaceae bacterium]|jgi:two-component system sensor histidine kinase YesM|nr:hypothetical protein [Paenibacillaceae bacterium]